VRSTIALVLVFALSACSVFEQGNFGGSSLNPNRIYLDQTTVARASQGETRRYACVTPPLICVQHGMGFECRCP
jgi:predicted Abi (CAAX) family protease